MNRTLLLAATLALVPLSSAHAQVAGAAANSVAGSASGSEAAALSGGNTISSTTTFEGSNVQTYRPVPSVSVYAPAPTSPCRGTGGVGGSWGGGGFGASFGSRDDECNGRENARSWMAIAGAAHALGDTAAARVDLETARQQLLMSNEAQRARTRAEETAIQGPPR